MRGALIAPAIAALIGFASHPAQAFSTGITGQSGKLGTSCVACHSGGVAPTVHFEGPDQLAPGAVATFRFVVQSQAPSSQVAAGLNVAASTGKLGAVNGQGARLLGGEITHTSPKNNDTNGVASWEFTWQAPAQAGTATLFGAGNSVNLSSTSLGDRSATTTFQVTVADAPTPTPTDTPTPTPPPLPTCVGDCDESGGVMINEIVTGISIALGDAELAACQSLDVTGDGVVTVDELLQAVNAALNGCPTAGAQ